jgi:hypothetical protein
MACVDHLLCPSAQPDNEGAVVFGVVSHQDGRPSVGWLETAMPVTPDLLALSGDTPPTQVLRIAAKCPESRCVHFDGEDCQLARRIVAALEPVSVECSPCAIRGDCRWFYQESLHVCTRCPQIVTYDANPDPALREVARPRAVAREAWFGTLL